jgi:hypothetical protein
MKALRCKLGGKCGKKLSAGTWDELVQTMTEHVMALKRPETIGLFLEQLIASTRMWGVRWRKDFAAFGLQMRGPLLAYFSTERRATCG